MDRTSAMYPWPTRDQLAVERDRIERACEAQRRIDLLAPPITVIREALAELRQTAERLHETWARDQADYLLGVVNETWAEIRLDVEDSCKG